MFIVLVAYLLQKQSIRTGTYIITKIRLSFNQENTINLMLYEVRDLILKKYYNQIPQN